MAKGNHMNTTEAEIKAVAKAVGASLKRDGHEVPHTAVLNALASALNKRSWNTLQARLRADDSKPMASQGATSPDVVTQTLASYSAGTWTLLRLSYLLKGKLPQMALPQDEVRAFALKALNGGKVSGVLAWQGWNMPCELDLQTALVDAGDFVPAQASAPGSFVLRIRGQSFHWEVGYDAEKGWFLSQGGAEAAQIALEHLAPRDVLLHLGLSRRYVKLPGQPVPATFKTDGGDIEVDFDARAYLLQASSKEIAAIIECEFGGDYATDAIAEWESGAGGNDEVAYGFEWLGHQIGDIGFECHINGQAMLRWLDENRRQVLAEALCAFFNVDLVRAQEEDVQGRWDWLYAGNACDMSFEAREEAALDAYLKCNLLQDAMQEATDFPAA